MRKKVLSLVLCVAMMASMLTIPALAAEPETTAASAAAFTDTANHWAATAIDRWTQYGIIKGEGAGKFNPDGNLTRGALATVLTNLLGLTKKAENIYTDLKANEWYADAVLKCTAAGIMKGDGAKANPGANITRQEAMVMLGRALGIQPAKTADLAVFTDADKVAPWAAGYVTALTKGGIVSGVGDSLVAPLDNMNRASVMKILDKAISDYVNVAGTYDKIVGTGIVLVSAPSVILKGNKIAGSLLIAEGVGDGEFTLDGTNVAGNTTVRGGGVNSFVIKGGSKLGDVTIARVDGAVRIVTSDGSTIETTYIDDGKDDVIMEGSFGNVSVAGEVPVTLKGADVKTVTATGKNADITVDKDSKVVTVATAQENTKITVAGTVTNVAATAEATGVSLNVAKGGTATSVTTAAAGSVIKNDGNLGALAIAKGADTVFAKGENATKTNITAADKTDLGVTTIAAQDAKEAVAKADADKLAAEQLAAAAKTDAEKAAAQAAVDKAAADKVTADKAQTDSKKEEDKVKEDTKVEEKPVTPPVVDEGGKIDPPKPVEPDKPKPNPSPSRVDIQVTAQDFGTWNGTVDGLSVGFNLSGTGLSSLKSVKVEIFAGAELLSTNTSKTLANFKSAGNKSTPFFINPKAFDYANDDWWNYGTWQPDAAKVPTKAVITATDSNGYTYTATNSTFATACGTWASLFTNVATVANLTELNTALADKTMIYVTASISEPVTVTQAVTIKAANSEVVLSGGLTLTAPETGTLTIDGFKITKSVLVNANTQPGAVVLKNNDLTMADAAAYGINGANNEIHYIVRFVTANGVAFNITMDHNTVGAPNAIQTAPAGTIAFLMNDKLQSNAPNAVSKFAFTNNSIYLTALHTLYNVKANPFTVSSNTFVSGNVKAGNTSTTAVTAYNGGTNGTSTLTNNSFTGYGFGVKYTQYDKTPAVEFPGGNTFSNNTTDTLNAYYAQTSDGLKAGLASNADIIRVLGVDKKLEIASGVVTIPEGKTLEIMSGKTLTVADGATLTNNGTIVVNDEAGLRVALAVGGNVQLGKNITLAAGINTLVNNLTLDGNNNTITFAAGEGFAPVYVNRGMVFQGKNITIKDLTIASGGVIYPLAIHRFGDAVTVSATLTNVTVNGAGKTALDIARVDSLVLTNVTAAKGSGFSMVLDDVKNLSGTGSTIAEVSIHNKWGAITNVDLTGLGVTSVVVEDFSQTAASEKPAYGYDTGDTDNEGNKPDWAIFTGATSTTFAENTVTGLTGFTSNNTQGESPRAYKVTFTKGA